MAAAGGAKMEPASCAKQSRSQNAQRCLRSLPPRERHRTEARGRAGGAGNVAASARRPAPCSPETPPMSLNVIGRPNNLRAASAAAGCPGGLVFESEMQISRFLKTFQPLDKSTFSKSEGLLRQLGKSRAVYDKSPLKESDLKVYGNKQYSIDRYWEHNNDRIKELSLVYGVQGYGNLAPSTESGQVFCVFYALVGIPFNVIFLNHLGTGLRAHLVSLERWEDQPRRSQLLQMLGLTLFLTLGTLLILIFPPMVFSHVEGWSFGEGFYFAFITLSTIGFGDYVVGTDPNKHYISMYRSLAAIWILVGLAWLALVLPLGPVLLHRCSQLWLLSRGFGLKEDGIPETGGLPRPQKIPISA
ncbi:potassium channel subfamily K member 16-like [Erinaceus europaeus]|uniref:Potassium channel subfamily K member 16-like n=1 Tax=Erinaceus europaeus TaxID=9365 RepID=A0ABM3X6I6_ERIEU|nr:potassium channel subfamily K member 16-like [Erinaceus europaeus]